MLAAVFRRGVGAYRTSPGSVRGNVTSATQWGVARVNAFIKGLKRAVFLEVHLIETYYHLGIHLVLKNQQLKLLQ